jgi:(1->4)-alpha-D-glucan 1-alpha-D-glucosylmutase
MSPKLTATYRLQLQPVFGFDQASGIVSYLSDLGISHLYTSPCLQAAAGSTHGYDIVDPSRISAELGGNEAHRRMCRTILADGLGQVTDIVPNHMAIAGKQNPWWWDVMKNGPASSYASYFDIDWEAEERWTNKLLLPVLGSHYGRILESGELRLVMGSGSFEIHYHDQVFPVNPGSLTELLSQSASSCDSELLAFLAESHARLPRPPMSDRKLTEKLRRDQSVLSDLLVRVCQEEPDTKSAIEKEIERINRDADAFDQILTQQHYRLSYWRMASRALGYRRFFDIHELAALRAEDSEVFRETHALPISWVRDGLVEGLRIDHPDGMRDPAKYFDQLKNACPDTWIVAEKILEPGEKIPEGWPIAGTTGYDFMNMVTGVLVDPGGEKKLTETYESFIGEKMDYAEMVYECKRLVITEMLASELNRLSSLFVEICERHRRHRDYTRHELREILLETAACFPVYRSYVSDISRSVSDDDKMFIRKALECAETRRRDLDPELFVFLEALLLLRISGDREGELVMRFQQLTGPAMAKGVEDTALYRYHRLTALNEVGGKPDQFGVSLNKFHEMCATAQQELPASMLATTTHDSKRSEGVRARLALLSEIPDLWAETVHRWAEHNLRHKVGGMPDLNTEYLLYQTLAGTWPIETERIAAYMEKSVREAKVHTSWTQQNKDYEKTLKGFISCLMSDQIFISDLEQFVGKLLRPGRVNSMAMTLIKMTAPGVPDFYQGSELWDLRLVDPDNRQPIDYNLRRQLIGELKELSMSEMLKRMDEGLPKMWLIQQTLHFRRRNPGILAPVLLTAPFMRRGRGKTVCCRICVAIRRS